MHGLQFDLHAMVQKQLFAVVFCTFFLCLSIGSNSVWATYALIDDISTMSQQSEVIIHAVVGDQAVYEDEDGRLITLTTLEVIEGIQGIASGELVKVYQVGGELNGRVQKVLGQQQYRFGDEVMLFAVKLDDMIVSYGSGIGKFNVIRENSGIRVKEDIHDVISVKKLQNGQIVAKVAEPRFFPSLAAFKEKIRQHINLKPVVPVEKFKLNKKLPLMPNRLGRPEVMQ